MNSLKNHILIAMPHLADPYFGKSVVLLCDHTTEGAMGIVVNRPISDPELKKLFSEIYPQGNSLLNKYSSVYFGGPVMLERGIVLHTPEISAKGTINISSDFALTTHKEILNNIDKDTSSLQFKLAIGHAGWTKGQLEREIENGDWLIQDTTRDFIFNTPDELMWNQAALSFGISPSEFSGHGGLA
tara:strand:- start:35 stop:592 length:558 start_codon:yes stop_codon:yes gene_type:complete